MKGKVKIIAVAPNSGWAFVTIEDKLFLFRPPYYPSNQIEATERDIEIASKLHIFNECDHDFNDIDSAIAFLNKQYVELIKKSGIDEPSADDLKEILKSFDDDTLLEYLGRTKNELIPNGKLDTAATVVADIMELGRENAYISKMAGDVIREIQKKRKESEELLTNIKQNQQKQDWQTKFPNAVKKHPSIDNLAEYISEKKQVFPIAA